mmetsp:Transcript_9421/g.17704  ORF Transcript_9421/g.17704 Transcript_9421/m.17704 type:complete len:292 (-) Transcript_9421:345-1220(-)
MIDDSLPVPPHNQTKYRDTNIPAIASLPSCPPRPTNKPTPHRPIAPYLSKLFLRTEVHIPTDMIPANASSSSSHAQSDRGGPVPTSSQVKSANASSSSSHTQSDRGGPVPTSRQVKWGKSMTYEYNQAKIPSELGVKIQQSKSIRKHLEHASPPEKENLLVVFPMFRHQLHQSGRVGGGNSVSLRCSSLSSRCGSSARGKRGKNKLAPPPHRPLTHVAPSFSILKPSSKWILPARRASTPDGNVIIPARAMTFSDASARFTRISSTTHDALQDDTSTVAMRVKRSRGRGCI